MAEVIVNALADAVNNAVDRIKGNFIQLTNAIWSALAVTGSQVFGVIMAVANPIATAVQNAVVTGLTWLSQNIAGKIIEAYNYITQNLGGTIDWFASVLFPGIGAGEVRFARAMARSVGTYMGMKFFRRSLDKLSDVLIEGRGSLLGAGMAFILGAVMPYLIPQVLEGVLLSTYTYARPQVPKPQIPPYQYVPIEAPEITPPTPEYKNYVDVKVLEAVSVDSPASSLLQSPVTLSATADVYVATQVGYPNRVSPSESVDSDASASVIKARNMYPQESVNTEVNASVELVS